MFKIYPITTALCTLLFVLFSNHSACQINFIENMGQWNDQVKFKSEINGASVYLGQGKITYQLYDPEFLDHLQHTGKKSFPKDTYKTHTYEVRFLNSNEEALSGEKKCEHHNNYYRSSESTQWATNVQLYQQVRYSELFQGIDMLLYQGSNSLKYDFIIQPFEDPDLIQFEIFGANSVCLENGRIWISTEVNDVVESEPYSYQLIDGRLIKVECEYVLKDNVVSFKLGNYDPNYKLIIDPELILATGTGSLVSNHGFCSTYDQNENIISGGTVFSSSFPTTLGAIQNDFTGGYDDTFINKFNSDGTQLLYSTYLGGSDNERPHSLTTSGSGDIYILGTTGSNDFPTTANAYDPSFNGGDPHSFSYSLGDHSSGCDMYISKINAISGELVSSTYLGGAGNDGINSSDFLEYTYADSFKGEIEVVNDKVIIASTTSSVDFPVTLSSAQPNYGGGHTDGVVVQLSSSLDEIIWSSYFGGDDDDSCYSFEKDTAGNIFITGGTRSYNLPSTLNSFNQDNSGNTDGYIVKLSADGTEILQCTYIGTNEYDQGLFIQLDQDNNVYVLGQTEGEYPIQGDVFSIPNSGQFIQKLDSELSTSVWSTTVGTGSGEVDLSLSAFLVNDCYEIFLAGWGGTVNTISQATNSTTIGLPITSDAFQPETDGSDFYLLALTANASDISYATFFGGGISKEHSDGGSSSFKSDGTLYQAVCSGCGSNDDFPFTPNAWSNVNNTSNCDLGVFKFSMKKNEVEIGIEGSNLVCIGDSIQFTNLNSDGEILNWNFGNNEESNLPDPITAYNESGNYTVTLQGVDQNGCLADDIDQINIEVIDHVNPSVLAPSIICAGDTINIEATGSANAFWTNNDIFQDTLSFTQTLVVDSTITLEFVDANSCSVDTVLVTIETSSLNVEFTYDGPLGVNNDIFQFSQFSSGTDSWYWNFGDGSESTELSPAHVFEDYGSYEVTLTAIDSLGCEHQTSQTIDYFIDGVLETDFNVFEVYPNPTSGVLYLKNKSKLNMLFEVTDPLGKIIQQKTLLRIGENRIRLNKPSGIYFLIIYDDNQISKYKVVKH